MNRRKFILGGTGVVVANSAFGKACPPILEGLPNNCPVSQDAEADWIARSTGPGVVWANDFRNEEEVNQFRWSGGYGNDPNDVYRTGTCNWQTTDGITGGACLETLRKAGRSDTAEWWRPLAPMDGVSNGRGIDDPAAGGTIPLRNFNSSNRSETQRWSGSFWGNPIYDTGGHIGHDYYIQCRVKIDPRRPNNPSGGKLFYFTRTDRSLTSQELVTISYLYNPQFTMYRSGSPGLWQDPPGVNQPNSELDYIWNWPYGQWVTVMYHIKGGTNANGELPSDPGSPSGNPDTLVEVWVDTVGGVKQPFFTKIWDQPTVRLPFDIHGGHNAIICSGYMNGLEFTSDSYHRYDQLIFSTQPIACPQF